jgi:hypothetical protein
MAFGVGDKPGAAAAGAKVVRGPRVLGVVRGRQWIDRHAAHGIRRAANGSGTGAVIFRPRTVPDMVAVCVRVGLMGIHAFS